MGTMPQDGGFFAGLTVAETIEHRRGFTPSARDRGEAIATVVLAEKAGVRGRRAFNLAV